MRLNSAGAGRRAARTALVMFAAAAACGVEAARTHLRLSSLGLICGLDRPALFFLHCPACPTGLAFLALGAAFAAAARRLRVPAAARPRA
jgi:hypothetical protein